MKKKGDKVFIFIKSTEDVYKAIKKHSLQILLQIILRKIKASAHNVNNKYMHGSSHSIRVRQYSGDGHRQALHPVNFT